MKSRIEQSAITSRYVTLKNGLPFTSRRSAKPRQIHSFTAIRVHIPWRLTIFKKWLDQQQYAHKC